MYKSIHAVHKFQVSFSLSLALSRQLLSRIQRNLYIYIDIHMYILWYDIHCHPQRACIKVRMVVWMNCVPPKWAMSHMKESCYIWMSHATEEWVVSHIWHIIIYSEQAPLCTCLFQCVISHMNESCHVMSHMNESCHIWVSHVTYTWDMSHINESCHIQMSHVTYE